MLNSIKQFLPQIIALMAGWCGHKDYLVLASILLPTKTEKLCGPTVAHCVLWWLFDASGRLLFQRQQQKVSEKENPWTFRDKNIDIWCWCHFRQKQRIQRALQIRNLIGMRLLRLYRMFFCDWYPPLKVEVWKTKIIWINDTPFLA